MNWRDLNQLKHWKEQLDTFGGNEYPDVYLVPFYELDALLKDYAELLLTAQRAGLIYG